MPKKDEPTGRNDEFDYARWLGFGIEFCGVLAVFSFMGYKLDEWLDSSPWCFLAGFFMGFAGMMYMLIKDVFKFNRR